MSGHSKWATTKHKKAVVDARRGKLFAKLIKNIEVAARVGGGDPAGNPTLYDAIQKAKKSSVPNDNIDRAVKRGSGAEGGGTAYETLMYEAYGPAGCGVAHRVPHRQSESFCLRLRVAVARNGGTMADAGSTARMFNRKGVVIVAKQQDGRTSLKMIFLRPPWTQTLRRSTILVTASRSSLSRATPCRYARRSKTTGLDYESAEVSFVPAVHPGGRRSDGREADEDH